jgi:maleate cis-trans isomerase
MGGGMSSDQPMKVGLMVPANNTTMQAELPKWLPDGSAVTTVKIPRGPGMLTREAIPAYRDSAIALARQHFGNGEVDLIAYGCTAAGFLSGPAGDAELSAKLTEATGLPVVTVAGALVRGDALPGCGERAAQGVSGRWRHQHRPPRLVPGAGHRHARPHHRR